jgi:hypothetical protein
LIRYIIIVLKQMRSLIMKLSEDTVQVLKNFSGINQSLLFKEGNVLKTISPLRTIYVEATVGETFTKEFAVFDLNKLLAKVSLYKDAHLSFNDDRVTISTENKKKSDYIKYCSPKVIVSPPEKNITLGDVDCSFSLSEEDLDWMRKSAGISGSPNFIFESDGNNVSFIATDVKDDAADRSAIEIGNVENGNKFKVVMKAENFKLLDGSYDVNISKKGLAQFKHKKIPITYYIAVEVASSTFGE